MRRPWTPGPARSYRGGSRDDRRHMFLPLPIGNLETPEGLASTRDAHKCYPRFVIAPRRPVHPLSVVQALVPGLSRITSVTVGRVLFFTCRSKKLEVSTEWWRLHPARAMVTARAVAAVRATVAKCLTRREPTPLRGHSGTLAQARVFPIRASRTGLVVSSVYTDLFEFALPFGAGGKCFGASGKFIRSARPSLEQALDLVADLHAPRILRPRLRLDASLRGHSGTLAQASAVGRATRPMGIKNGVPLTRSRSAGRDPRRLSLPGRRPRDRCWGNCLGCSRAGLARE